MDAEDRESTHIRLEAQRSVERIERAIDELYEQGWDSIATYLSVQLHEAIRNERTWNPEIWDQVRTKETWT